MLSCEDPQRKEIQLVKSAAGLMLTIPWTLVSYGVHLKEVPLIIQCNLLWFGYVIILQQRTSFSGQSISWSYSVWWFRSSGIVGHRCIELTKYCVQWLDAGPSASKGSGPVL